MRKWTVKGFEKYLLVSQYTDEYVEAVRLIHAVRDIPSIFGITGNSDRRPTQRCKRAIAVLNERSDRIELLGGNRDVTNQCDQQYQLTALEAP
jgi:hypothetical protein